MTDAHGEDVMALVRELSELEFRRGVLHAQIDWHLRLRQVAAQAEAVAAPVELELVRSAQALTTAHGRGKLRAAILAYLAEHPDRTPRQVAEGIRGHYGTTRQALVRLAQAGRVRRTKGGSYAVAESHDGSGLVAAQG